MFVDKSPFYIALTILELTLQTRLASIFASRGLRLKVCAYTWLNFEGKWCCGLLGY